MPREIVRADFDALFKLYADKAIKRFNLTGKHPPQLYSVKLGKEPGSIAQTGALNRIAPMFFGDGDFNKDHFRVLLQELTTPGSTIRKAAGAFGFVVPDIVVQINEVWYATETKPAGMTPGEAAKLEYVPPSERPDRQEAVAVFLHAYHFTTMGSCPIVDKPKRHAVMGELFGEDGKFVGRLSMTLDDES
jgi:hypothetical protein